MANIFFDYDGTLINSQKRMYTLFCELCPENKFTYEQYWVIKQRKINQKEFLKKYFDYTDKQIAEFKKKWMVKIEEKRRLLEDKPVDGVDNLIKNLSKKHKLYIVTNRQSKDFTIQQIKIFGWFNFFDKILVTEQKKTKVELIKENVSVSEEDVFIGDTGEDILTAKELKIKSIAVTYGILNKEAIEYYKPDLIIEEVKDFDNCQFI